MSISEKINLYQQHESLHVQNRALIILMTLEGQANEAIAEKVGLTLATVKKWQNAWEEDGINIFPEMDAGQLKAQEVTSIEIIDEPESKDDENEAIEDMSEEIPETATNLHNLIFLEIPQIAPTNSMAEAGRIIMLKQLQAMLEHEPIARKGKNVEGVHQMRVATRRWRSAYDTFGDYLPKTYRKGIPKDLKQTAKQLGEVRDLDVFILKANEYLESESTDLQPMMNILKRDRKKARKQLSRWLDDKQYHRFIKRAFKLLTLPIESETLIIQSGELTSTRLDHVLPVMIYQRFEAVRRYEEVLSDASIETLHSLRKDCKRFRYILEMFSGILGEEVQLVIGATKMVQDHLGDMVDAGVAIEIIRAAKKRIEKSERPALKAYRKYQQAEIARLQDSFSEVWSVFNQADIRYALAQAVAKL